MSSRGAQEDRAVAAAILVQTIFNSDDRLNDLLKEKTKSGPERQGAEATANFLKPWYTAMLKMITEARG